MFVLGGSQGNFSDVGFFLPEELKHPPPSQTRGGGDFFLRRASCYR